jgi:hypothetical protein
MPKTVDEIVKVLTAKTPGDEIRYLPQSLDKENRTALALAYIDARFVQDRLDLACGPLGWQTKVEEIGGFLCVGIGIINPADGEWVWKWDTGADEPTEKADFDDEADGGVSVGGKSIVSRGFKRAAVQWGIGRDLYDIRPRRRQCRINARGKFGGWEQEGQAPVAQPAQQAPAEQRDPPNGERASYNEFNDIAKHLKWSREEINSCLQACKGADGKVDFSKAVELAKKQLPPA